MSHGIDGLQSQLREQTLEMGATYFGVADLTPAVPFITRQGDDFLAELPTGLSIGFALADGVVDQLYRHDHGDIARLYRHHIYTVIAGYLERTAGALAFRLEREGYRAIPISPSGPYDETRIAAIFSNKLTAHLAGLGWIGKNCLLTTKQHGPRVRWVTVLTDAPLSQTGRGLDTVDHCKSCRLCVDLCPVQAFTGVPFDPADPVEVRFDIHKCKAYLREREKTVGANACGICVYSCPHGWSLKRKKQAPRLTSALLHERLRPIVARVSGK